MVKGVNRQVIVVKSTDQLLFDQAIFILREDALEKDGIGERELLDEAQRIVDGYMHKKSTRKRRISPLLWLTIGAIAASLIWILVLLL